MPWNGAGTFALNQNFPADRDAGAPDHFIDADKVDDELQNLKGGLENCLTRTGETTPSANTPWNAKKITNLADATNATDALNRQTADARFAALAGSTLTGAMLNADGSVSAPSVSFDSEPDCGLYYVGANDIGFSVGGSKILDYLTTGISVTGTISITGDPTAADHVGDRGYNDARYNQLSNNLSDVPTKSTARTNLGLAIGTNVQAWSSELDAVAAIAGTAYGRPFLSRSSASGARAYIGVGSMSTREYTASTSAPSGGADGDVWYRYT